MLRLTALREERRWSRAELARRARMGNADVGRIESGRLIAYPGQLVKLADAIGWPDDPAALLDEVGSDA